ncbi:hypothetical protein [Cellulomonas sp. ATA003]|uniref:hypothetical protein n=1 Tax=Cellulomonas sp. ATA003 TaxID=3073064 RepID=UPI00287377ED|nr:hypothetical protein [Cellulomonas sp. ATA003]WNB84699.1 hypothetical protein REH70_13050 [Cellulomonas sp. ATA003]
MATASGDHCGLLSVDDVGLAELVDQRRDAELGGEHGALGCQVDVRVDQSGQQRRTTPVDDFVTRGDNFSSADRCYQPTINADMRRGQNSRPIEDAVGLDDERSCMAHAANARS